MNSNLSLTDDLWQSTLRLFQEVIFHLQFPGFSLELAQPRSLIHGQRRFLADMLMAVGTFVDTELLSHAGNRTRRLDHHLHGFILEFRREALLRSKQLLYLSRHPSSWMGCPEASGHPREPHTRRRSESAGTDAIARFCGPRKPRRREARGQVTDAHPLNGSPRRIRDSLVCDGASIRSHFPPSRRPDVDLGTHSAQTAVVGRRFQCQPDTAGPRPVLSGDEETAGQ